MLSHCHAGGAVLLLLATAACAAPRTFHVSPGGNDAWPGGLAQPNAAKTDGPVASLERARDLVRAARQAAAGPLVVQLHRGTYERTEPLALGREDSGTAESPVAWRGDQARLVGGKVVSNFTPVTDPAELERLDPGARGKVVRADLKALGLTQFGNAAGGGTELFFKDQPMTVARWPNEGFVKIVDVLGPTPVDVRGTKGTQEGIFTYDGDRPSRWVNEKDAWVHGYWFWDWSDQRQKIASIEAEKKTLSLAPPYHGYGYRKGQWYYAFNLLCELDQPGECYLDRETGVLYFYPPAALGAGQAVVSVAPQLLTLRDTSYVSVSGLTLEATTDTAVTVSGGTHNEVAQCVIRNTGSWAVQFSGSEGGVTGCDITNTARGGIALNGGDRKGLTPANLYADNNHIHHYSRWARMYNPAVAVSGVGNRVSHNLIHDAPHEAISFSGNEHVIELNEIHNVCMESNDAGAIYNGRDWSQRGTVVRHNYLHHINGFEGRGCVGVYQDDSLSGNHIVGNVFYEVTMAAFIGGGRDCTINNNVFVDCRPAIHVDARAVGWMKSAVEGVLTTNLKAMPYDKPPWSERYPQLLTVLQDEPGLPKYNTIARNVCVGGKWDGIEGIARPLITFQDNLLDQDPRFVDAEHHNYQLREDSPAWKLGFERIPVDQIGLYRDAKRASWPVAHAVIPLVTPPARAARKPGGQPPVYRVTRLAAAPTLDGSLAPAEWAGLEAAKAMLLAEDVQGSKSARTSRAWLFRDAAALWVAIDNLVSPQKPIATTAVWGQDDAVELAFRHPAGSQRAPILVLRGFPNGLWSSSDEAGAPAAAVKKLSEGVGYAAKVVGAERWTAEWRVPLASLGIDPAKPVKVAFNLSVRKPADDLWLMWRGTESYTWEVDNAGILDLS